MKNGNRQNSKRIQTGRPDGTARRKPSARPGKLDTRPTAHGEPKAAPASRSIAKRNASGKGGANASHKTNAGRTLIAKGLNPKSPRAKKALAKRTGTAGKGGLASGRKTPAPLAPGALYCPIDGQCGGCQLLIVPYAKQLRDKQLCMENLFADLIDETCVVRKIIGMADPTHYRNKVISPFVGVYDKRARRHRILCGMYARGTHRVIDSSECLIENRIAKRIILTVRDLMPRFGVTPYDEDADTGFLRHAQVRVGHATGEVMVTLVTRDEQFPASRAFVKALVKAHPCITTVVQNVNTRQTNVIMGDKERTLYGPGFILDELCGLKFRISSKSFYQVNVVQTEELYRRAVQMAALTGTETLMDAYCGTGTIGLVAARGVDGAPGAARVIGVEERPDAVADARNNARHNGVEAAEFVAADAGEYMRDLAAQGASLDVLMMDPPRAGSTPDFLKAACTLAPKRIVYISCNPDTQARDVRYLIEHGYRVIEMQSVDMFPHTPHVENIVALVRDAR
jgi:23S rRNA (uracil1939-C5)-methyltransferase